VENIPAKVNAVPARYRKVFGFVTGMAFTFAPESRSPSSRNAVRLPTGIAFGIDRIHHAGNHARTMAA